MHSLIHVGTYKQLSHTIFNVHVHALIMQQLWHCSHRVYELLIMLTSSLFSGLQVTRAAKKTRIKISECVIR